MNWGNIHIEEKKYKRDNHDIQFDWLVKYYPECRDYFNLTSIFFNEFTVISILSKFQKTKCFPDYLISDIASSIRVALIESVKKKFSFSEMINLCNREVYHLMVDFGFHKKNYYLNEKYLQDFKFEDSGKYKDVIFLQIFDQNLIMQDDQLKFVNRFLDYYENHSAQETCKHFNIKLTYKIQKALSILYPKNRKKSSKYKGVYFNKQEQKYRAVIQKNGKRKVIGRFDNEEKAAIAYKNEKQKTYEV